MASNTGSNARDALVKEARKYRSLNSIMSWLDRYIAWPLPPRPSLVLKIPCKTSKEPGEIQLYFFTASAESTDGRADNLSAKRPVLINFHGGGFSIGHPLDDSRWFAAVLHAHPGAVVVSVGYRLAPEYPFPIGIEDGTDAILWLWENAFRYNLDPDRFAISGFSAGGNLAFTVPLRLHEELAKQQVAKTVRLAGIVAFYPPVDWTKTRDERDATNPIAPQKSMTPQSVLKFFDSSYLAEENLPRKPGSDEIDIGDPYLSPGLTPSSLLLVAFPPMVAIYTCGWDQLLVEGNRFRDRLQRFVDEGAMTHVGGMEIEAVIHGFDKRPCFFMGNPKRDRMYEDAMKQLEVMWEVKDLSQGSSMSDHSSHA
ncbi:Alpha/beta hydrolase fold-3 [Penicillium atrosanguineum]|uniref:Alpha/beta hydrolase fold-3 n=1 Tax=Penicillium atrosanguineum TaxID=1132637 RepID=A0A9W9PR48_9EURO|nr:Alpha/beta hydrolase fold-3 [Penicillium atrosanguineum]